ncbi:MAG: tRNA pseudouridine(55) synthase TruB [Oscillospiraceae bacterium]|nr:tRNA pseudouridine(55) synthase TruB [Oscillospiraceae bacterium]
MNGFVVLDKKEGISSFKASSFLRKIYNEKKTGHTGTLDPMATGVLPVAVGKATRFIDFIPDSGKAYTARFRCGVTTDTLDITGKVLSECSVNITAQQIEELIPRFRGEIAQLPPMYSAISVNGQRLYSLARQGIEVERQTRLVEISELELTDCSGNNEFEISVACSKGTYIRSLISDIGEALGCGAVMTALRRTSSNGFSVENSFTEEEITADPAKALLPLDHPFLCYESLSVTDKQAVRFSNGGELSANRLGKAGETGIFRVYSPIGTFLGLGEIKGDSLVVLRVTGDV